MSYELNPAIVERAGLQFAMERLCGKFRDQFNGVLRLQYDPTVRIPLPAGNAIHKITELALDNALTHAHAKQIDVLVKAGRGAARVEIRDNGKGFDSKNPGPKSIGLGLMLMEHHAQRSGVQYTLSSAPGKGTIVRIRHTAARK